MSPTTPPTTNRIWITFVRAPCQDHTTVQCHDRDGWGFGDGSTDFSCWRLNKTFPGTMTDVAKSESDVNHSLVENDRQIIMSLSKLKTVFFLKTTIFDVSIVLFVERENSEPRRLRLVDRVIRVICSVSSKEIILDTICIFWKTYK